MTEIKKNAFSGCTALATGKVIYLGAEEDWNKITLTSAGNSALNNVIFHDKCNAATLGEKAAKEPTCEEAGHRAYYECIGCGTCYADAEGAEEITDLGEWLAAGGKGYLAPAHSGKEQAAKAAACTEAGYKAYYQCSGCEKYFEDAACTTGITDLAAWKTEGAGYIAPLGHTGVEEHEAAAATCTAAGHKAYYQCGGCSGYFEDAACTTEITDLTAWKAAGGEGYIAPAPHDWSASYGKDDADAEKHYHACTVCGAKDEGAAHAWNIEAATEDTDKSCTVCHYVAEVKLSHTHGVSPTKVAAKAPTCTAAGNQEYYECSCGKLFTDEACTKETTAAAVKIGATGHDFTTVKSDAAYHWYACANAGCTEIKDKQAHDFTGGYAKDDADAEKHYHVCPACGAKDAGAAHDWNADAPTEDEDKYCKDCGYVGATKTGHVHNGTPQPAQEPTCTEAGYQAYYKCGCGLYGDKDCKEPISDLAAWKAEGGKGYIQPLGHKYDEVKYDKDGHWKKCVNKGCGAETGKEAHSCGADGKCTCGYVKDAEHTHSATLVPAKAAACTTAGHREYYECTCGAFADKECKTAIVDLAAWLAAGGDGYTAPLGHKFTVMQQDDEYHWHKCANGGCFETDTKTAHAYGEDGKCTCGKDKDVKHEHKGTLVEGKEGTCLVEGTKPYYSCICGKNYEDEACTKEIADITAYLPAGFGAHELKETTEVTTLCEKAGCKAYYGCGVCGKYFEDKDAKTEIADLKAWAAEGGKGYLAPLGHEFGDYVSDESGHFRKCTREGCTGTSAKEAHDYSVKASDNENYWKECGVCGHVTEKKPLAVYVMPLAGPVYSDGKTAVYLDLEVYCGWERLVEGADYTVKYKNNKKFYEGELPKAGETAGKDVPSATVTGKGDYMGASQQVVYFNILPVPEGMTIEVPGGAIDDAAVRVEMPKEADYAKGGVTVPVRIYFKDKLLRQGKDYTIKFKNNKASGTADVEVKGKGAFKGSRMEHFTIRERALGGLVVVANDKATKGKTGLKTTVAVYDRNGKKLSAGKDYDKNIEFTYASDAVVLTKDGAAAKKAGDAADAKDTVSGNAVVQVKVTAKAGSGYTGSAVTTYVINENTLAKAKITFNAVEFSGKEATVSGKDVSKAALGKETLTYGTDFEIDQTSYCGNTKKGTAYVVIIGKGRYAGCTKRVSFKVTAKKM